ncbi:di-trans,poly-cis-decaprenylcistransferase [Pseudoloma neurophilia]|uniref:Di-trans,poly-cis-decaprenylcistransferase n=1 Tax=Pseudoloma neurophilia TaxID=146866 RepID=A0A0R0M0Y1_9MICR|nr:di-trans,poly-cis-decaprenylcistransferase [Pseudoloma neurophilia]
MADMNQENDDSGKIAVTARRHPQKLDLCCKTPQIKQKYSLIQIIKRNILIFTVCLLEKIINCKSLIKILKKIRNPPIMYVNLKIAIIPDGNRRFYKREYGKDFDMSVESNNLNSKKNKLLNESETKDVNLNEIFPDFKKQDKADGKWHGSQTLLKIIKYLEKCDEITIYTYSLQNFQKRNEQELNYVFKLLESVNVSKLQGKIRFIGRTWLLSEKQQDILKKIENHSNNNSKYETKTANLLLCYSGLDELAGKYNTKISKPDILIRTGYQKRMSDFLIKHAANGVNINFVDCFWPELTEWHVFFIILKFMIEKHI